MNKDNIELCIEYYENITNQIDQILTYYKLFNTNKLINCVLEEKILEVNNKEFINNLEINQKSFNKIKQDYKNKLYELCNHNFITDYIDINSEKSQHIFYCVNCGLTKKNI